MDNNLYYVLAEQRTNAPEGISYFMGMTGIGPAGTYDLGKAAIFDTEQEAMNSSAFSFALTRYKPCPVVGDMVGRPVEWLDTEMEATKKKLEREWNQEDPSDGIQVFS